MDSHIDSNQTGPWTNEKHLHFLNSMEAAFVRTMLENNGDSHGYGHGSSLRLDRYLPDSSESTLDLKSQRRKKHTNSDIVGPRTRIDRRTRRLSSHRFDPSQDQVVPQLENRNGDKDERDSTNAAAAAPVAPAY